MAGVRVEMDKVYPPLAPQIVYVTTPARSSLSDVKYKCLYLVAVILDMIETIVEGIGIVIALFAISLVQSFFKSITSGPAATSDVYSSNGFNSNGYSSNGYSSNGFNSNGYSSNGYSSNGYSSNGYSSNPTPKDVVDWDDGILWGVRLVLVIILAFYIQIQVWGWRGHRDHNTCAIYAFASFKIMSTLLALVVLCVFTFNAWTFLNFLVKLASVVISFLFAHEVSNHLKI